MPDDLLFWDADVRTVMKSHEQKMFSQIDGIEENRILSTSVDDLSEYFKSEYTIDVPTIDEANIQTDYSDASIDVSGRFDYVVAPGRSAHVTGTKVTFFVPFQGDANLFKCRASTFGHNPPRAKVTDTEIVFTYERTDQDAEQFKSQFERDLSKLKQCLGWITGDVAPFNSSVGDKARQRIEARRDKLLKDRGLAADLGFSLRHRENTPQTYVVPTQRRRTPSSMPLASTEPFVPEPTLDMQEYEHILFVITNMVAVMERSPKAFQNMAEEDLRQHFLVQLNGQYEGQATGETFNFEGKTDILIRAEGKNIFIAECKFWDGPQSVSKALGQLLGYATWRDTKTALVIFNRDRALSTVLSKIPEVAARHPNFKRQLEYEFETGFRFILGHNNDLSRELIVTVLVFEVPA